MFTDREDLNGSDNNNYYSVERQDFHGCFITFWLPPNYDLKRQLSYGAYGSVWAANSVTVFQDTLRETTVAIKKISHVMSNTRRAKMALRELRLQRISCQHENITQVLGAYAPPSKEKFQDLYIIQECMDSNFFQVINQAENLSIEFFPSFMLQIIQAVEYIHSANIMHRDIKPGNILFRQGPEGTNLKLCDFGLSRIEGIQQTLDCIQTKNYRAPEICLGMETYDKGIDMWSVGCILAELLTRKVLFSTKNCEENKIHLAEMVKLLGSPSEEDISWIENKEDRDFIRSLNAEGIDLRKLCPYGEKVDDVALDLLRSMLQFNPNKRITATDALKHPYFAKIPPSCKIKSNHLKIEEELFDFDTSEDSKSLEYYRDQIWQEITLWNKNPNIYTTRKRHMGQLPQPPEHPPPPSSCLISKKQHPSSPPHQRQKLYTSPPSHINSNIPQLPMSSTDKISCTSCSSRMKLSSQNSFSSPRDLEKCDDMRDSISLASYLTEESVNSTLSSGTSDIMDTNDLEDDSFDLIPSDPAERTTDEILSGVDMTDEEEYEFVSSDEPEDNSTNIHKHKRAISFSSFSSSSSSSSSSPRGKKRMVNLLASFKALTKNNRPCMNARPMPSMIHHR